MPRLPRTTFAAPLVVTLAAVPGCVVAGGPAPAARGTAGTTTAVTNPPRPAPAPAPAPAPPHDRGDTTVAVDATPLRAGTPSDQVQQAPPPRRTTWTVYQRPSDQQCFAAFDVACSPKATCNPPPPRALDECPAGMTADQRLTIEETSPGVCALVFPKPAACGANPTCDPPRSRPIDCP